MDFVQLEFMEARDEEIKDKSDSQKVRESIKQTFEEMFEMLCFLIKMKKERTVLVKIHLELYPISCEVLDQVFYGIGNLESIERLSPEDGFHSRICFQDRESAVRALESMNQRYIYACCCRMELFLEAEIVDRTSEIEISNQKTSEDSVIDEQGKQAPDFAAGNELQDCQEDTKAIVEGRRSYKTDEVPKDIGVSVHQIVESSGEQKFLCDSLTLSSIAMIDAEMETIDENCMRNLVKTGIREVSIGYLERFPVAHKVFDKMPNILDKNSSLNLIAFDPGGDKHSMELDEIESFSGQGQVGILIFYPGVELMACIVRLVKLELSTWMSCLFSLVAVRP